MKLALAQINTVVGDLDGSSKAMRRGSKGPPPGSRDDFTVPIAFASAIVITESTSHARGSARRWPRA